MFILVSLFLIGFISVITGDTGLTGDTTKNLTQSSLGAVDSDNEDDEDNSATTAANTEDAETLKERVKEALEAKRSNLTNAEIKKIIMTRNRIKFTEKYGECPVECTCTGSTIKCTLASGREMTVVAGKSGNVIVQVKGDNMTTNVTLYRSTEGKIYGIFKNNETRIVRMLPDQVKERIRERIKAMLENENIRLDENGTYQYDGQKKARLFFIIPVRVAVKAEIDSETGELIKIRTAKWWAFLAKDVEEPVLGASCGTVTPGENDNCCETKGFDVWNSETQQCEFSE